MPLKIPDAHDPQTWANRPSRYSLTLEPENRAALEVLHSQLGLSRQSIASAMLRYARAKLAEPAELLPYLVAQPPEQTTP